MPEHWYRHADTRFPFLWDGPGQPAARWHAAGEGPVQYLADTPDGAWAEFLRHEEIVEEDELQGVRRNVWAVEVDVARERPARPALGDDVLTGGRATYEACRREAARLRAGGARALVAPAAALRPHSAGGEHCAHGALVEYAADRDGRTLVVFGSRPLYTGWLCCAGGRPAPRLLRLVRPFV